MNDRNSIPVEIAPPVRADRTKSDIPTVKNYINGKWTASSSGESVPNINPAHTDEILNYTPLSTREEARSAIAAAKQALPAWSATPAPVRGRLPPTARPRRARAD